MKTKLAVAVLTSTLALAFANNAFAQSTGAGSGGPGGKTKTILAVVAAWVPAIRPGAEHRGAPAALPRAVDIKS